MANPPTSTVNLKALGLNTQPNELSVEPGSLSEASDIVIRRDNVIEPRRGFKLFGEDFGTSTDRITQLFQYKERILRHYNTILQFETDTTNINDEVIFDDFCGSYSPVEPGIRIKSIEANGNFYFTTSTGIQKISARTAADFTSNCGFVTQAGGIKALDIEAFLNFTYGVEGFLPPDSAVAYRVVWGTKDLNGNLILGVPSARAIVYNSLQEMIVRDYMVALENLDNLDITAQSNFTSADFVETLGLSLNAPATDIQANLIELATKLDEERGTLIPTGDILSASVDTLGICTVTLTASSVGLLGKMQIGDKIFLEGTWNDIDGQNISGVFTVTNLGLTGPNNTIQFLTTSNPGTMTLTGASIESGWFRSIVQPPIPSIPATNAELVALQTYLENILFELQSDRNIVISANTTSIDPFPLLISSVSVTTTTNLQIDFDASNNVNDVYLPGDKVFLAGTWDGTGGDLSGYYTITSIPSDTQINITIPTTTVGPVTTSTDTQIQLIQRFSINLQTEFVNLLNVEASANVTIIIPIPEQVDSNYFFQIYRSNITTASQTDVLADLIPDDEMRLVYEAYPTQAELDALSITVVDITPQSFFQGGAFLYTDETNGDGILQANEIPPLAYDINTFKNVTFYANTRTRHRLFLSLLGISKIITDYDNGDEPTFSIASSLGFNNYKFVKGVNQITEITIPAGSVFSPTTSNYFLINGGNTTHQYYVWFNVFGGTTVDPALADKIGIEVVINSGDTNVQVAQKVTNAFNVSVDDFSATIVGNIVTVTNTVAGPSDDISPTAPTGSMAGVTGYSASVLTPGDGENVKKQITEITTIAGNLFTPTGSADYFSINSAFNRQNYYFWFNVDDGNDNPGVNGLTGVEVNIDSTDTASQVAVKLNDSINLFTDIFSSSVNSNIVTVTNFSPGPATNATENVVDVGFTISTTQQGLLNVLLSNSISPSLAVQETTQSLINVINKNNAEIVYGYYLSGITDVPGNFLLEERTIENIFFYVLTNSVNTGSSFNPDLSPSFTINNITQDNPTTVTTVSPHQLGNQDQVMILNSNSFPPIDGIHEVTNVSGTNFNIPVNVIVSGNEGYGINLLNATISSDERKPNRVYYSKYLQPEAVPLVNFLDVGAQDKAILRIIPLRDSLFVLKEDGVYRISGETAPFNLALFDTSYILIATDSVAIANNIIYGWTTQGIMTLTESGSQIISRAIDVNLLPLASDLYPNFSTATFGVGYNSEYSYLVWTVKETIDDVATQAFIYNNLTSTWVRWDKSNTCGLVKDEDNKLYLGDGEENYIQQERKDFTRTDYADKEFILNIAEGNYQVEQAQLKFFQLNNVNSVAPGDVITQNQKISIYDMNKLLMKLDNDPSVNSVYSISSISYDTGTGLAHIIINEDIDSHIVTGNHVVVDNINPIGYNGIVEVTTATSGVTSDIYYEIDEDPGTHINDSEGTVTYSYFNTLNPQPGESLRTTLEDLAAKLQIDLPITIDNLTNYVNDIAEINLFGLSVSAENPAVFTMSAHSVTSISGTTMTVTGNPFIDGNIVSFDSTGTLPFPLSENTNYYVLNTSGDTFNISEDNSNLVSMSSSWIGNLSIYLNHGLKTGRYINVSNSTTTPNINKNYEVTYINGHQFSIEADVSTAGTADIITLINNFNDIRGSYNIIIDGLNMGDSGTTFKNYEHINSDTLFETPITNVNYSLKEIQIETVLPFIIGPITIYKAIPSTFEYSPISMNDGLSLKHFREATIMYLNRTFSFAEVGFASDLLPEIITIDVPGFGAGLQGNQANGEGYYGGNSNSSPFRTYIPLEKARCRFLRVSHEHSVAREKYSILGTSLTGRIVSTRGYR